MTQTARETPSSEDLSSSPHIPTLILFMFAQDDGELEAEKRNLEDQMVCVEDPRKIVEKQLSDLEVETSKLADRVTAALVNYEQHMRDYHGRLKLMSNKASAKNQSNDTTRKNLPNHWREVDAPFHCFGMEIDSLKGDGGRRGFQ